MLEHRQRFRPEKFRVWVEDVTTKTPLKEFQCTTYKNNVSCYITSDYEHKFSVHLELKDVSECISCDIYIDGQYVRGVILGKMSYSKFFTSTIIAEIHSGAGEIIPLQFGRTKASAGSSSIYHWLIRMEIDYGVENRKWCEELGTIKVKFTRAKMLQPSEVPYYPKIQKDLSYNLESISPLKIHGAKYSPTPISLRYLSND